MRNQYHEILSVFMNETIVSEGDEKTAIENAACVGDPGYEFGVVKLKMNAVCYMLDFDRSETPINTAPQDCPLVFELAFRFNQRGEYLPVSSALYFQTLENKGRSSFLKADIECPENLERDIAALLSGKRHTSPLISKLSKTAREGIKRVGDAVQQRILKVPAKCRTGLQVEGVSMKFCRNCEEYHIHTNHQLIGGDEKSFKAFGKTIAWNALDEEESEGMISKFMEQNAVELFETDAQDSDGSEDTEEDSAHEDGLDLLRNFMELRDLPTPLVLSKLRELRESLQSSVSPDSSTSPAETLSNFFEEIQHIKKSMKGFDDVQRKQEKGGGLPEELEELKAFVQNGKMQVPTSSEILVELADNILERQGTLMELFAKIAPRLGHDDYSREAVKAVMKSTAEIGAANKEFINLRIQFEKSLQKSSVGSESNDSGHEQFSDTDTSRKSTEASELKQQLKKSLKADKGNSRAKIYPFFNEVLHGFEKKMELVNRSVAFSLEERNAFLECLNAINKTAAVFVKTDRQDQSNSSGEQKLH